MRAEDQIQAAIIQYLAIALPSDSYVFAIPNGAVLAGDARGRAIQSRKLKATGMSPGAPDVGVLVRGQFFGLEVKSDTGRLQPAQKAACERIIEAGGLYSVVRSAADAERFLRSCGVQLKASVS